MSQINRNILIYKYIISKQTFHLNIWTLRQSNNIKVPNTNRKSQISNLNPSYF